MKIPSLLNPQPEQPLLTLPSSPYSWQSDKATPKECSKAKSVALSPRLKQDLGVSDYNYKRFKPNSAQQRADMQDFDVKPIDDPHPSPRSIPYSSDKKGLKEKTGMDGFSVLEYSFRYFESGQHNVHANHKILGSEWRVMWDYRVGLVRITPFFKCQGHGKTIPAHSIKATPGLDDLVFSITGGSLDAQGYWMPYPAAKALASKFCYNIRWALIPLFGPDFPSSCIHPTDPLYDTNGPDRWAIDPAIVDTCKTQMLPLSSSPAKSGKRCSVRKKAASPSAKAAAAAVVSNPAAATKTRSRRVRTARYSISSLDRQHGGDETASTSAAKSSRYAAWDALPGNASCGSSSSNSTGGCSNDSSPAKSFKRSFSDHVGHVAGEEEKVESPAPEGRVPAGPKKRVVGWFQGDEARAAYALLKMSGVEDL